MNTVTRVHPFSGSITRSVFTNGSGTYIRTVGAGNADGDFIGVATDAFNDAVGPVIFNYADGRARAYAAARMGCYARR